MRLQQTIGLTVGFLLILSLPSSLTGQSTRGGQGTATDQQHRHQHPASSGASVENAKPSLSAAAQTAQERLRLEDLEKMALENNPTLAQAAADIRAAEGRRLQAGLYPNPTIGAIGDENTPGPIIRGGEFGVYVEQRFVTARKLGKSRNIAGRQAIEGKFHASDIPRQLGFDEGSTAK